MSARGGRVPGRWGLVLVLVSGSVAMVASILGAPGVACAHELRPALLSITQIAADQYQVDLRVPVEMALLESPVPIFPPGSEQQSGTVRTREGGSELQQFRVRVPGGLSGRRVAVQFARGAGSDEVLVRVAFRDGRTATGRLVAARGETQAEWIVPAQLGALAVARTYLVLGVAHILGGLDHLAFVLALVLLTPAWARLWKSVTAFTAAHSLTLALAALGVVRVPPAPVEAAIALSIVLVAREVWLAQRGQASARAAWSMAFGFGLLHGLGFAGALSQIGLPPTDIPLALATFNLGVEIGQLAFVACALLAGQALSRLPLTRDPRIRILPAYAIGITAAFWCFQRIASF